MHSGGQMLSVNQAGHPFACTRRSVLTCRDKGKEWVFSSRSRHCGWCLFWWRKGVVRVDLGHFSWLMAVENHHELVFLSSKVPLCT